ncbi:hypothetical protein FEAC_14030 [Ferrimicrobium acidiphilum DSM 19497]|uniref:Uncharacterized protein n=1 Tax=Ferrimicrobium acidiphilum DSM 19497 TaxID=1121877 RepID=A0A0D8FUW4_9ACTN|nr:hypothetical protein FEAC_14030 [Ferrimicrobium acidiphilum DSM 19497]
MISAASIDLISKVLELIGRKRKDEGELVILLKVTSNGRYTYLTGNFRYRRGNRAIVISKSGLEMYVQAYGSCCDPQPIAVSPLSSFSYPPAITLSPTSPFQLWETQFQTTELLEQRRRADENFTRQVFPKEGDAIIQRYRADRKASKERYELHRQSNESAFGRFVNQLRKPPKEYVKVRLIAHLSDGRTVVSNCLQITNERGRG